MKLGRAHLLALFLGPLLAVLFFSDAFSQPFGGTATTEKVCRFGMAKDEPSRSCEVPIPFDCKVASFPGTNKPWASISKGGNTSCLFDERTSDWEKRITGTCGTCKSVHCSAEFSVRFNCGGQAGSTYKPQQPDR